MLSGEFKDIKRRINLIILSVFCFLFNIVITCFLSKKAFDIALENQEKALHFVRISFSVKIVLYFPCVFSFAFALHKSSPQKWMVLLPFLHLFLLLIIDTLAFYRPIKKIRQLNLSIKDYLFSTILDMLIIVIPALLVSILRIYYNGDNLPYVIILILLAYNILYPFINKLKYKECEKISLSLPKNDKVFSGMTVYKYNGKAFKEANAMVVGIVKPFTVFISDYLIEELTEEELLSVIYHEIGHIKMHHLLTKNVFLITFYPVIIFVGEFMDKYFSSINIIIGMLLMLFVVFLYCGLLFMFISRMQEYQADAYAVTICQNKQIFISALQKIQKLNLLLGERNFGEELLSTHPSIKKRIAHINDLKI